MCHYKGYDYKEWSGGKLLTHGGPIFKSKKIKFDDNVKNAIKDSYICKSDKTKDNGNSQ